MCREIECVDKQRKSEREKEIERARDSERVCGEREREREISICKNKEYKKAKSFIWMF